MKCASHFRLLISAAVLAGCHDRSEIIAQVSPRQYSEDSCWFEHAGDFVGFLVIDTASPRAASYLTSAKCDIRGEGDSYDVGLITHLNEWTIVDEQQILHRLLPATSLMTGLESDQGTPSSRSKVYLIKIRGLKQVRRGRKVIVPRDIVLLRDTGHDMESFLGMSRSARSGIVEKELN
jgi:hypothetical protein